MDHPTSGQGRIPLLAHKQCLASTDLHLHLVADKNLRHEQQPVMIQVVRRQTSCNAEADRRWFHSLLLVLLSWSGPPSPLLPIGITRAKPITGSMVVTVVAVACTVVRL